MMNRNPLPPEWGRLKTGSEPAEGASQEQVEEIRKQIDRSVAKNSKIKAPYTERKNENKLDRGYSPVPKATGRSVGKSNSFLNGLFRSNNIIKGIVLSEILGPPRSKKPASHNIDTYWTYSKNSK